MTGQHDSDTTLPSVTQVLSAAGLMRALRGGGGGGSASYLARGRAVHRACELDDQQQLDEVSVDPRLTPYLRAHRTARRELALSAFTWETRLRDPVVGFHGQPDVLLWKTGRRYVVDWKSGDSSPDPATVIQLAAYRHLVAAIHLHIHVAGLHCASLHYHGDGTYRWEEYDRAQVEGAWQVFAAALLIYHWRAQHKRLPT